MARTNSGTRRLLAALVAFAYALQPLSALAGPNDVVADPHAGAHQPVIQNTTNGLPLVQISAPSKGGVSSNWYTQFNVGPNGLIFNNSPTPVNTKLAGYVPGNMFLGYTPASVILNQITSGNASQLLGYMEVAGQKAQLVIANPNGITCAGCGFINVSRGTLTTGLPLFGGDGMLSGFNVTGGQLTISGSGLNASNIDQLDLSGRTISVGGPVYAKLLNGIAGVNQIGYTSGVTKAPGASGPTPVYAIDVAGLGGMYAGRIYLISTEAGAGVRNAGTIASQFGSLTLSTTDSSPFPATSATLPPLVIVPVA